MSTDEPPPVLVDVADGIARVTINRPEKRNALNPEAMVRLADAWQTIEDDTSIRVAILTGAGETAFCAGGDLATFIPLITNRRQPQDEWDRRIKDDPRLFSRAMLRSDQFTVPVIAAVRGFALAGGTELAMGADILIASEDSRFGLPEVARGLIPGGGGIARLTRGVSYAHAAEIVLIGDQIDAAEALRMGLVNRVVPSADVLTAAENLARRMTANGPLAMRTAKQALIRAGGGSLAEAFRVENEAVAYIATTEDAHEGPRAFVEKRTPRFVGR